MFSTLPIIPSFASPAVVACALEQGRGEVVALHTLFVDSRDCRTEMLFAEIEQEHFSSLVCTLADWS